MCLSMGFCLDAVSLRTNTDTLEGASYLRGVVTLLLTVAVAVFLITAIHF